MPGASWFKGAELNYAENILTAPRPASDRRPIPDRSDDVALLYASELRELGQLTWGELAAQVAWP